jgi:precorrin-2 dehydrogenase/sirohydrochlorin ferrochelatase
MEERPEMPSRYYPLFLSLEGRSCLVVGGGGVGERKVGTLLKCGATVLVVARELSEDLEKKRAEKLIEWVGSRYESSQLAGISLVFAATDDLDLNRAIAADARQLGVWCNMATEPEMGSFIVPSVLERGVINVAVSTTGRSPAAAKLLRQKLEREIGPEWDFFVRLLGELREIFKARGVVEKAGRDILSGLARLPIPEWLVEGRGGMALEKTVEICRPVMTADQTRVVWENLWNLFSW